MCEITLTTLCTLGGFSSVFNPQDVFSLLSLSHVPLHICWQVTDLMLSANDSKIFVSLGQLLLSNLKVPFHFASFAA